MKSNSTLLHLLEMWAIPREKKKVKVLVEEIAKNTDLPENKIHGVIAKVHKANKIAFTGIHTYCEFLWVLGPKF